MNMLSLSAADAAKFYWMRYSSERATIVTVKDEKVKISKNDLFGVRELKGKPEDEILLTTGVTFRLAIPKSERLMDKAKEFKGKTPVIQKPVKAAKPVAPKVVARQPVKVAVSREQIYAKLVGSAATLTLSKFEKALPSLKDDAERVDFKNWCIKQVQKAATANGTALIRDIRRVVIGGVSTHPIIVKPIKRKATVTQLVADDDVDEGPVKVKMSRLELPDEDDFTDTELPEEFRRYTRSESAGKIKIKIR